ncbi:hypothetical protein Tco_0077178 [Tanacetum coccineum]
MLEKDMYDSWKSIMELYMMNRQHGRMILESVENGSLIGFKLRKWLCRLPPEVFALVSNHKVAKKLWERIQLLMQGTSLTKQERECKLYDEFDKFAYKKGETLRDFYLRFSLLLNDMNIYNMKLKQFQVNIKFLNTLPPKWSKFMTDVKLVRDLHTTNVDQLHAYLGQHEFHVNKYGSPYQSQQYSINQLSTPLSITYPSNDYQSSVQHNNYSLQPSIPHLEYAPTVYQQQQQSEFPQLDSGLIIPVFKHGDDPIDAINHMMSSLTSVITSRYPTTNNQLRNSSNPRQQATITDGREQVEAILGNKGLLFVTTAKGKATCPNNALNQRENRMIHDPEIPKAQATQTVITHNAAYQVDDLDAYDSDCDELNTAKVALMANLSHYGDAATVQNSNSSAQQDALILSVIEQLKTQVVNCTKINLDNKSVNDTLTAELKRYKEQVKVLKEGQNVDLRSNDNVSDSCAQSVEIDRLKQTLSEHLKEKESLMQTVILLKNDFKKEESRNIDREIALEKRIKQLDNIVFKRDQSAQTVHMLTKPQFFYDHTTKQALGFQNPFYLKKAQQLEPKLYDGNVIKNTSAIVIPDSEETLMLAEESRSKMLLKQKDPMMLEKKVNTTPVDYANSVNSPEPTLSSRPTKVEVPKELPKVSMVNTSLKKLKYHLAGFDVVVKERTTPTAIHYTEGSCNGCMLSDNHDLCVLDFINNVNARRKSKSVKKNSKRKDYHKLAERYPFGKPTAQKNETPKPVVTLVYSRKPKKSKTNVHVSKSKVVKIVIWVFGLRAAQAYDQRDRSCLQFRQLIFGLLSNSENDHVAMILGYGDDQIGNVTDIKGLLKDSILQLEIPVRRFLSKFRNLPDHKVAIPHGYLKMEVKKLYMMNRQHGRMILESVENGPLIWPSIEENGVSRPKKYSELSTTEAIQVDSDIKATNIFLGLPHEVYALAASGSNSEKQRTVIYYNCKGEGHMSKQCTKPKRKRDDLWFKDKVLLVQAQANSQILHEEELAFLADPALAERSQAITKLSLLIMLLLKLMIWMHYDLIVMKLNDYPMVMASILNRSKVCNHSETKINSDSNIIPYSQYVIESQQAAVQNSNSSAQQDALILSVIEQLKT